MASTVLDPAVDKPPGGVGAEEGAEGRLREAHGPVEATLLQELSRPVLDEVPPTDVEIVSGALPPDLPRGAVLKNGPNQRWDGLAAYPGRRGWFDGDGFIHTVVLPPDGAQPRYSARWVKTSAFEKERAAGKPLFEGSLVAPYGLRLIPNLASNFLKGGQAQKDTANTGLLPLGGGRLLALMEQCLPSIIVARRDGEVVTSESMYDRDGDFVDMSRWPFSRGATTAHFKRDPASGESIGVAYASNGAPSVRVDVMSSDGRRFSSSFVALENAAQTMVHDSAITRPVAGKGAGYVLVLDFPITIRPSRIFRDKFPVEYEPGVGARIGLVPRGAVGSDRAADEAVWIPVEPSVVLHTVNAHENEDGTVTLTALRSQPTGPSFLFEAYSSAFLYEWVLDPAAGRCRSERALSAVPMEFPALDPRRVGSPSRYAYALRPSSLGGPNRFGPPSEGLLFDAVVKLDLGSGEAAAQWAPPAGWRPVSEPTFVPRLGSSDDRGAGDDGYLLVYATHVAVQEDGTLPHASDHDGRTSRLFVLDAAGLGEMPVVAELALPGAVPYGLHSAWVPYDELQ